MVGFVAGRTVFVALVETQLGLASVGQLRIRPSWVRPYSSANPRWKGVIDSVAPAESAGPAATSAVAAAADKSCTPKRRHAGWEADCASKFCALNSIAKGRWQAALSRPLQGA